MAHMDSDMHRRNASIINFQNANFMYTSLEAVINQGNLEWLTKDEYDTEEECVLAYTYRCTVIRLACEYIEHMLKAIYYQQAISETNDSHEKIWSDLKRIGHSLQELYTGNGDIGLSDDNKSIISRHARKNTQPENEKLMEMAIPNNDVVFYEDIENILDLVSSYKIGEDVYKYWGAEQGFYAPEDFNVYEYRHDNSSNFDLDPFTDDYINHYLNGRSQETPINNADFRDYKLSYVTGLLNDPSPGQKMGVRLRYPGQLFQGDKGIDLVNFVIAL